MGFINKKNLFICILIFCIIGTGISGFLTYAKYTNNLDLVCGGEEDNSCKTVQESNFATIFEVKDKNDDVAFFVPLSLGGLFFYIGLMVGIVWSKFGKKVKYILPLFVVSLIGAIGSIILMIIQFFILKETCIYCLISTIDMIAIFLLMLFIYLKIQIK